VRIIFDQGTPVPLRQSLTDHDVATAFDLGWSRLGNGELLTAAENAGFEVLITTDLNLKYQQNLKARRIAVIVLSTPSWPRIEAGVNTVALVVDAATPGSYAEVAIP
jgi:hypothetical protein